MTAAEMPTECVTATITIYKGTIREKTKPYIMPVYPWCETHNQPRAMCAKDARIRELLGFIDLFLDHIGEPTDDTCDDTCDECVAITKARAALARSDGGGA